MKKTLLTLFGCLSLILGILGVVLPLLPTTPFVLLSAALFVRSSPRLYAWLMEHPALGKYIRDYEAKRPIPARIKYPSITLLWTTILLSIHIMHIKALWLIALLLAVAIGVTWHLLTYGRGRRGRKQ